MTRDSKRHEDMSGNKNELDSLDIRLVDQNVLENDITRKANESLISRDAELDGKRLEKSRGEYDKVSGRLNILRKRLEDPKTKLSHRRQLRDDYEWLERNELDPVKRDMRDIIDRLESSKRQLSETQRQRQTESTTSQKLPGESDRDYNIRTGRITAFGNVTAFQHNDDLEGAQSHVHLRRPGVFDSRKSIERDEEGEKQSIPENESEIKVQSEFDKGITTVFEDDEEPIKLDSENESNESNMLEDVPRNADDGDEDYYQRRLRNWVKSRSMLRGVGEGGSFNETEECFRPHPKVADAILNSNYKLPGDIYPSLFEYQKTCVQWLWELYSQKTGGIIGDEMGLGKTIQVISFLAGLHYSKLLEKPILVVVPATVMSQWVNEFHKWWPPLRCVILHSIGLGMSKGAVSSEEKMEAFLESTSPDSMSRESFKGIENQIKAKEIIERIMEKGHVLVTTYVGLRIYSKFILPREWGYVILDEGHKIRNPDLDISLTCKQIKTHNRIILSGTPIQNNLVELWSLFDFIYPGRLGTLPIFEQQFAVPIKLGGYANASNMQVQTGYKCAVVLRDLIVPYLLRRLKSDVAQDLPKKNEMVLFVKLTKPQQDLYESFLKSGEIDSIIKGKRNVLMGVDILRKISNHPDLVERKLLLTSKKYPYGSPSKSGKMQVLKKLLQLWKTQGHRILLFCQTRQMLDILESFVRDLETINLDGTSTGSTFNYLRMDGSTPISKRMSLVDAFNEDTGFDVFLLTTKVGGIGINLTGADRVIIFDPDWNPSTDIQARERAWRLGQKRDITIYRLMTAGTIEEKIYHRQIFKTFLTNKILKDPKQRRFFKVNDIHDLFTLGDQDEIGTETGDLFEASEAKYGGQKKRKTNKLVKGKHTNDDDFHEVASIQGVSKLGNFEGEEREDNVADRDDNRLMEGIFSNSDVHSALKHEEVVSSSLNELSVVEKEANKIASEAAEMLKKSRKLARKQDIGTPTWTGRFGMAGRFGPKKSNRTSQKNRNILSPLSSASILGELKKKKLGAGDEDLFSKGEEKDSPVFDKLKLLNKLVHFLAEQEGHFSPSAKIMTLLDLKLENDNDVVIVRSMLREVADWDSLKKGWQLKKDYET